MSNYRIEKDAFKYNFYYILNNGNKVFYGSETCVQPKQTNIWKGLDYILKYDENVQSIDIEIDETSGNS